MSGTVRRPGPRELGRRWLRAALLGWRAGRRTVVLAAFCSLLAGLVPVATATLTQRLIDAFGAGLRAMPVALTAGILAAAAVGLVVPQVSQYLDQVQRREIVTTVEHGLFAKVLTFVGLAPFERPELYDRLRLAQSAGVQTPQQVTTGALRILRALVSLVGFVIAVWSLWPPMIVLAVLATVPALLAELRLAGSRADLDQATSQGHRRRMFYQSLLTDGAANKEIRLYGIGGFLYGRMAEALRRTNRAENALDLKLTRTQLVLDLVGWAVSGFGLLVAVHRAAEGRMTGGGLVIFIAAIAAVQGALLSLVAELGAMYQSLLRFGTYLEVMDAPSDLPIGDRPAPPLARGIELRDVWFRYDDDGPWVLRGVNFTLGHGQSVGLVGENGAGKSTLVKLLCRFYDPQRGVILWDGVDIRAIDPTQLRTRMGAVFQDFVRYDLTAAENIALGDLTALDQPDRIRRAARLAEADHVVEKLPDGYRTMLSRVFFADDDDAAGGVGTSLSGGQWQRLAIARSLVRTDVDLLILDEPSSGLDAAAEQQIHYTLTRHRQGRTSLLISHRLNTVRGADRIVVLADGVITESGSHAELMRVGGVYAELFTTQAEGYLPESVGFYIGRHSGAAA